MSELSRVIEFVRTHTEAPRIALARMSLMVGEDVNLSKNLSEVNSEKTKRYILAAEKLTGKKYA